MKTQCPQCHTKFKVPDEHEGKKAKCPKCGQLFVISRFVESISDEICSKCARKIGKIEQACVFNGQIVCSECDQKIRGTPVSQSTNQTKETEWLSLRQASKIWLVLGTISVLAGVCSIFAKPPQRTITPFNFSRYYDKLYRLYINLEPKNSETLTLDQLAKELDRFHKFIFVGGCLGVGVSLLVGSFKSGPWSGHRLLGIFGGYMLGCPISAVGFGLIRWGLRINFGAVFGLLILAIFGSIILQYAFRPKKKPTVDKEKETSEK